MRTIICGALVALTVTAAAQELNPFQHQVLGGIKKMLVEYVQKQHANCNATSERVCEIARMEVMDEVLENWENTPSYGKYAVEMLDWHGKMAVAIAEMANNYVLKRGRLDAGFENELLRKQASDPLFQPLKEYTCRHMFGTPHLYGAKGDYCK